MTTSNQNQFREQLVARIQQLEEASQRNRDLQKTTTDADLKLAYNSTASNLLDTAYDLKKMLHDFDIYAAIPNKELSARITLLQNHQSSLQRILDAAKTGTLLAVSECLVTEIGSLTDAMVGLQKQCVYVTPQQDSKPYITFGTDSADGSLDEPAYPAQTGHKSW